MNSMASSVFGQRLCWCWSGIPMSCWAWVWDDYVVSSDERGGAGRTLADAEKPAEGDRWAQAEPAWSAAESHQSHGCCTELNHGSHRARHAGATGPRTYPSTRGRLAVRLKSEMKLDEKMKQRKKRITLIYFSYRLSWSKHVSLKAIMI